MTTKQKLTIFLSFLLFTSIHTVDLSDALTPQQEADRITALPGQPPVNFSQFSGYVTVNEAHGRALFYWLTEATTDSEKLPLVLWLNGGPGCSSIAYGGSEEIGPFRINRNGSSLYLNDYSWNKVANLLFLESPAGVGFSYTNVTEDLKDTGDERTAQDALIFLIRWFARFPQYNNRDFYLSGESYAGHYVPQLAKKIVDYNNANPQSVVNFKGFIVGNADMDKYYDLVGTVAYWWSHSIISDHAYYAIMNDCNLNSPTSSQQVKNSETCKDTIDYAWNHEFGNIDQYSIYTPSCLPSSNSSSSPNKTLRLFKDNIIPRNRHSGYDPCSESYAEKYYNTPEVQKALHANTTRIPYSWTACSDMLFKNWKDAQDSMLPTYEELMAAGLRIWVFSGDTDSVVPVTATRFSMRQLNLRIKTPWYPWYLNHQVGGWTEVYDGLTFVTVRGSGHEVPHIQPDRAFRVFRSFLVGEELPAS